jgi:hypothetical protein
MNDAEIYSDREGRKEGRKADLVVINVNPFLKLKVVV